MSETAAARSADWQLAFDARPVRRRIGLVALATDHTSERDFWRICPHDEVGVYVTRVFNENPTTVENLKAMLPRLTAAAELILPGEPLDAVAYGCTSATVAIGEEPVTEAIQKAKPGVACITPPIAAIAAFAHLGLSRVSLLTPYIKSVSTPFVDFFEERGLDVVSLDCFELEDDRDMARIAPASLVEAAKRACDPKAEALFISCTAVRAAEVVSEIEAALGKPVVTSNQATVWQSLRAVGCTRSIPGFGQLLR